MLSSGRRGYSHLAEGQRSHDLGGASVLRVALAPRHTPLARIARSVGSARRALSSSTVGPALNPRRHRGCADANGPARLGQPPFDRLPRAKEEKLVKAPIAIAARARTMRTSARPEPAPEPPARRPVAHAIACHLQLPAPLCLRAIFFHFFFSPTRPLHIRFEMLQKETYRRTKPGFVK